MLVWWKKRLGADRARVICSTGHTLDDMFNSLMNSGIKHVEVFMGTKRWRGG